MAAKPAPRMPAAAAAATGAPVAAAAPLWRAGEEVAADGDAGTE